MKVQSEKSRYPGSMLLIACLLCLTSFMGHAQQTLKMGIVPQHAASKIVRAWTPIANWLNDHSGLNIKIETAKNIPEFEYRLSQGIYDIAYMNPFHFVVFNEQPGYQALARQDKKRIKGIIVVRKDSGLKGLADLNGKKLAFPSPAAFAATLVTQANLKKAGARFTPKYVSSHDSVYLSVSKGLFSAGGGVLRTFNNMPDNVRDTLQVLWTSDGYTPHAVATHPRLLPATLTKLKAAFTAIGNDAAGLKLLEQLKFKNGFLASSNEDWDDVRELNIDSSVINQGTAQ